MVVRIVGCDPFVFFLISIFLTVATAGFVPTSSFFVHASHLTVSCSSCSLCFPLTSPRRRIVVVFSSGEQDVYNMSTSTNLFVWKFSIRVFLKVLLLPKLAWGISPCVGTLHLSQCVQQETKAWNVLTCVEHRDTVLLLPSQHADCCCSRDVNG